MSMVHFTVFYGNAAAVSEVLVMGFFFCLFFYIIQQNFTSVSPVLSALTEIRDHIITRLY